MKGIKKYFKPASEIVAKETNVETNIIAKETNTEQSQSSIAKETSLVAEKPCQPSSSFSFPKTAFGKQNRSCQSRWFTEFSWLDYDEVNNLEMEKNKEEAFLSTGFRNWKKALDSFKEHQKSECHIAALTFEITIPQCGNIQEMTSEKIKSNMQGNRKCLIKIIETIQFLGRQMLALRGDKSDENSNFIQLLKLRSKDLLKLKEWLERKTEKDTSHDIQNELLKLMTHHILRDLTDEMRDSFYATICDEYTDISNKVKLTLCLRWVDELFNIHEYFLGFYQLENIKSDTIVSAIRDVLLRTQISLEKL